MTFVQTAPILHEVRSVAATAETGVYILNVDISDVFGDRYDCNYTSRPEDPFGLNPTIRDWLDANLSQVSVQPYVAPTADDIRSWMAPVTARQLRLTLVRSGFSLASISAAIHALPEGQARDEAEIEWEYATSFDRTSPTLLTIAAALELSPETVDVMWNAALAA